MFDITNNLKSINKILQKELDKLNKIGEQKEYSVEATMEEIDKLEKISEELLFISKNIILK